jgi:alginate O-acetyltransferase complex protein AlgI
MCYVSLFPQLVAGPIVRYNTVAEQLHSRTHTSAKFYRGLLAFQAGLVKKVLVADVLGEVADQAFGAAGLSPEYAWLGALAYTFQIYFDFSGYSDMAIGLGLMLGFRFPDQLRPALPFASITEFWRRWHISLSTFLRDYLYIPLGGNRKGVVRTYFNLSLTMLLGGLWHGANWTFIAWGAYQGFWLVVERLSGKASWYAGTPRFVQMALTFLIVIVGWVLFRAADLPSAIAYLGQMFGAGAASGELALRPIHWTAGAVALIVTWGLPTTQRLLPKAPILWALPLQVAFALALVHLHYVDHVPFLYFQF